MISKVRKHTKFNISKPTQSIQTDVFNEIFNGKTNKKNSDCWIFLPAIDATVFSKNSFTKGR